MKIMKKKINEHNIFIENKNLYVSFYSILSVKNKILNRIQGI